MTNDETRFFTKIESKRDVSLKESVRGWRHVHLVDSTIYFYPLKWILLEEGMNTVWHNAPWSWAPKYDEKRFMELALPLNDSSNTWNPKSPPNLRRCRGKWKQKQHNRSWIILPCLFRKCYTLHHSWSSYLLHTYPSSSGTMEIPIHLEIEWWNCSCESTKFISRPNWHTMDWNEKSVAILLVEYETNQILAEKTNERPLNVSTRIKVTSQEFASATESGTIDVVVYPGHPEYAWTHQMVYQQHQQPIPTSNMERFCVKILSLILPIPLLSMGIISCVICYNENDPLQKFTVGLFLIFVSSIFWGITTFVLFSSYPSSVMKDDSFRNKSLKGFSLNNIGGGTLV